MCKRYFYNYIYIYWTYYQCLIYFLNILWDRDKNEINCSIPTSVNTATSFLLCSYEIYFEFRQNVTQYFHLWWYKFILHRISKKSNDLVCCCGANINRFKVLYYKRLLFKFITKKNQSFSLLLYTEMYTTSRYNHLPFLIALIYIYHWLIKQYINISLVNKTISYH